MKRECSVICNLCLKKDDLLKDHICNECKKKIWDKWFKQYLVRYKRFSY